jgi:hypothetical protein
MSARYALRLQFDPYLDSGTIVRELLDVCRGTHADEIVLMIFLNEWNHGHETLDEIREWLAVIRPLKILLEGEGIEVSLNPGHTIMQCDRGRRLKPEQDWQTMVDWKGQPASAVVCPLDPSWRKYFRKCLTLYSTEGYRVIWIEDDIRLFHHPPLEWGGCFCPLHVAEFNQRSGTLVKREEIARRILQPGPPHPWRAVWLDMWDETQTAIVNGWRQIVEGAGARLGLMSSGPEMHAMEGRHWSRWWKALARDLPPVHRPHFTAYGDATSPHLPWSIAMMDMNRTVQPEDVENGPEIESSPHGWSKSDRQIAASMVLAQVSGADRLNISVYDYLGNLPSDDPSRIPFLADWKPTLMWIAERFPPTLRSVGIGCPWDEEMVYHTRTQIGERWMELHCRTSGWPVWLGGFGHAIQMRKSGKVNALAGELAWAFSDDEIEWMLARGLLLDGPAAAILAERGFETYLGINQTHFITQKDVLYVFEETVDAQFGLRNGACVSVNDRPCSKRLLQAALSPHAQVVSVLKDPKKTVVGHGAVIFENELGGRVAVCPWDVNAPEAYGGQRNLQRMAQISGLVRYLARRVSLGSVSGAPWLVCQFLTDADLWRGVVWNAGPDEVQRIEISLPAGMPGLREAVQLDAKGQRSTAEWDGETLQLRQPLHQWESLILCGTD